MSNATNLIFFLTDNHARSVLGCYGHPIVKTPNLDKIAETGVRFTNAYCASPLCCPSRAALATGLFRIRLDTGTITLHTMEAIRPGMAGCVIRGEPQ